MFFIGIMGIENKIKDIKSINDISCKGCNKTVNGRLIKNYTFFHFFFIPLFKWNESYYLICNSCGRTYGITKEKGKAIEKGENIEINYWDLQEVNTNSYGQRICSHCGRAVEGEFIYCPYCGKQI